jgi:MoaA/NifB/PqqE/SkfB family radical SAM enzyme
MSGRKTTLAEATVEPSAIHADSADLYINTRCNFGCETCFLGDEYFAQDREMSRETAAAISEWLVHAGVRDVAIIGGEPTLHSDLVGIAEELRRVGIEQIRLITNGTPRARKLLAGPLDGLVDITYISLDGATQETNDALRGRGTFQHAMRAIDLLRERSMRFIITSTLGRAAVEEVDQLLALAENSGCQTLNLHWLSSVGRARGRDLAVPPARWRELVAYIAAYEPKRSDLVVECQVGTIVGAPGHHPTANAQVCAVRDRSNLQFMPDGSVFACGLLVDTPDLAGYRWDGERLLERTGNTELAMCEAFGAAGCPARQELLNEPPDDGLPVCIYERVTRGDG